MADKGIVMCSYMNRALLAKRKFRTMRAGSLKILSREADSWEVDCKVSDAVYMRIVGRPDIASRRFSSQYEVRDRLYVKEAYEIDRASLILPKSPRLIGGKYLVDGSRFTVQLTNQEWNLFSKRSHPYRPTSGRFMYKSLARIFMTVTKVTVQRPQELTAKEWVDEGIYDPRIGWADQPDVYIMLGKNLRDSLHGEGSYDRNEWCFVPHWENIEIKGD